VSDNPRNKRERGGRRYYSAPKVCAFCTGQSLDFNYKNVDLIRKYITNEGKIRPRRQTGTCARHQRMVAQVVKQSRHMALIPFSSDSVR
jgi:small subunit ribosomal protein S18